MFALRWAIKGLVRTPGISAFFIANFALGLVGFLCVEAYKDSISEHLTANAKQILAADLSVSVRREFSDSERALVRETLPPGSEVSEVYDFFSMIFFNDQSRLILVKAVDSSYPLYGQLEMSSKKVVAGGDSKDLFGSPKIWAYAELQEQMGMQIGSTLKLGNLDLTVSEFIEKDASQTFRAANLAPRVFIDRSLLKASGLIQVGSTFTHSLLVRLPAGAPSADLRSQLFSKLPDPAIQVDTSETASEDSARQLKLFSDYLSLVSIVALFLASIGASYLFRLFLSKKLKEMAVLRCLGVSANETIQIALLQTLILGAVSVFPALILARAFIPVFASLLNNITPFSINPGISGASIAISFALASIGSLLICLPFAIKVRDFSPAFLFSEFRLPSTVDFTNWSLMLPAFFFFWGLAIVQSRSMNVGTVFVLVLLGFVMMLTVLGLALMNLMGRWKSSTAKWNLRYSLKGAARRKSSTLSVVITLGLASMLLNILPQLKVSLQKEFATDQANLPSLFLFDIQEEQKDALLKTLKPHEIGDLTMYPLVRSRVLAINGQPYERVVTRDTVLTREEEQEARSRNRGVNLSYRDHLSSSESIVEGRDFSGAHDLNSPKPVEISVEVRYAERVGLKIGDKVDFDIQGVPLSGQVINLRQVKWASFQPNFFILLQPGSIDDAPKTYIAAVPQMLHGRKLFLQKELVKAYPNISIIDLARTTEDVLKLADRFRWSLELMAVLGVLSGMVVLYSVVRTQIWLRRRELNLLKVLGAKLEELTVYVMAEFLVLAVGSVLLGILVSFLISFALLRFVFNLAWHFDWIWPLFSVIGILGIGCVVIWLGSRKVMRERPMSILRSEL